MINKKNNAKTEAELFDALVMRSNSLPLDTCKQVYYGLVKTMMDEFRNGREVNLPGLGRFALVEMKGHRYHDVTTGSIKIKDIRKIAFAGCVALKKYLNEMIIKTMI
jgi:nucleoid DNA-binding protein